MRYWIPAMLVVTVLLSCSEDRRQQRPPGQTVIETNPMAEIKAEIEKDPRNADAWFHLADLYERSGMFMEEIDALTKVVSIDPSRGYTYVKLGNAYNRLARYPEAIEQFQKARKYLPGNPVLYNNMAFSYGKLGRTSDQINALQKAVTIRPRYATARHNLGVAYLHEGRKQDAIEQYRELKKFDEGVAASLKAKIDGTGK